MIMNITFIRFWQLGGLIKTKKSNINVENNSTSLTITQTKKNTAILK